MSRKTILATYRVECGKNRNICDVAEEIALRQSVDRWEEPRTSPEGVDILRAKPYLMTSETTSRGTITISSLLKILIPQMGMSHLF